MLYWTYHKIFGGANVLKGMHCIAGQWIASEKTFQNEPVQGTPDTFSSGTLNLVDQAVRAAEDAFLSYSALSRAQRAAFLRRIADEIDAIADELTPMGHKETGLPEARIISERGRTVGQIRLFAEHIEKGDYLCRQFDPALPERTPPRADLRAIERPVGPVAIFGASNFPLAFSAAGGDTAAALAAGCTVVVKGHSAHPGTCDLMAQAICRAAQACGIHPGVFSLVQGNDRNIGKALVQHPLIKAVGFTGSVGGGRALYDLCCSRPEPIPFYGELGSVNPVFVLPEALRNRGKAIAAGYVQSLTLGAGQFCTNPGIVVLPKGKEADEFIANTVAALKNVPGQTMLNSRIATAYAKGCKAFSAKTNINKELETSSDQARTATPQLYSTTAEQWLADPSLVDEVFGPLGLVILADGVAQMLDIAKATPGQLTCTIHMDEADYADAAKLLPLLERVAGRILANDFPTGVEVCDSMVHGGPYPASTNFGLSSVGTASIRRFLRSICYQSIPSALLPEDLR